MAVFEKASSKQGYSEPKYLEISKRIKRDFPILDEFFRGITFTVFYARLEDRKNILKFEVPRKITEKEVKRILTKIKKICTEGYPYLLKKAHKDVVIHDKDIKLIEKIFGLIEKTGREML
jgi:NurA-like 5'-3' nuclease